MDMNGKYGPNVYGKDLRDFEIRARKMRPKKDVPLDKVIEAEPPQ